MTNWLSKIPFVGWIMGNVRLVIEYVLLAAVIAIGATAFTLWLQSRELALANATLTGRVATVELTNTLQDQTIDDLQDLRKQDAKVMAGLVTDFKYLSKSDSAARKKLSELEKRNEKVRNYLDEPLPDELVCLLNDSCTSASGDKGGAAVPAGGASGTVRSTHQTPSTKKP